MSAAPTYITTTTNLNTLFESIRRHERISVNVRVAIELVEENRAVFAQTSDLSLGGLAAYISTEMAKLDQVVVVIQLPYSRETLRLPATIRNRNSFRYGLEFNEISAEEQEKIQKCLTTLKCMQ